MAMGDMFKTIKLKITTNEKLWPFKAIDKIQQVMELGQVKYPDGEGWNETAEYHVTRAEDHILAYWAGDDKEDHLAHAFARLMMAIAIERGYAEEKN